MLVYVNLQIRFLCCFFFKRLPVYNTDIQYLTYRMIQDSLCTCKNNKCRKWEMIQQSLYTHTHTLGNACDLCVSCDCMTVTSNLLQPIVPWMVSCFDAHIYCENGIVPFDGTRVSLWRCIHRRGQTEVCRNVSQISCITSQHSTAVDWQVKGNWVIC
jgi:hypothetical protein